MVDRCLICGAQQSRLHLDSSQLALALACHPFTRRSYFRQRETFLAAHFHSTYHTGFEYNQNKLPGLVILTGLDMKMRY